MAYDDHLQEDLSNKGGRRSSSHVWQSPNLETDHLWECSPLDVTEHQNTRLRRQ